MNETIVSKLFPHTLPNGVLTFIGRCLVLKASTGKSGVSLFDDEPVWVQRCLKVFVNWQVERRVSPCKTLQTSICKVVVSNIFYFHPNLGK